MSDLGEFIKGLEKSIPLRKAMDRNRLTETMHLPYGECKKCEKEPAGTIKLYDMVDLANIVKEGSSSLDVAKAIMEATPYAEIFACEPHLKQAVQECYLGKFEARDNAIKDPLDFRVADNTLIKVESRGDTYITPSYPLHPSLRG